MTTPRDPDVLLSAYLHEGMTILPDRVVDSVLDEVHRTRQRPVFGPRRTRTTFRTTLAAAAVVVAVVFGGAFFVSQRGQPAVGDPSPTAASSASSSQAASVAPSSAPTATPRPTAAPLTWTPASLKEDWPAPVRTEPAGAATIVPILLKDVIDNPNLPVADQGHTLRAGHYVDPAGDIASDGFPWVDIDGVGFCGIACLKLDLVSDQGSPPVRHLPLVGPTDQWMAYGVVFDTDRDGVADWRYGVDNMPLDGSAGSDDKQPHRAWRTDLHTGRTESAAGPPYGMVGETFWDTAYPGRWIFGGQAAGGGTMGMKFDVPFYVWASEIKDGGVVATDYAPNAGWLLPSPNAKP